jgi:hypothetical protein
MTFVPSLPLLANSHSGLGRSDGLLSFTVSHQLGSSTPQREHAIVTCFVCNTATLLVTFATLFLKAITPTFHLIEQEFYL